MGVLKARLRTRLSPHGIRLAITSQSCTVALHAGCSTGGASLHEGRWGESLHEGRSTGGSTRAAPRGSCRPFYTDVHSILILVLWRGSKGMTSGHGQTPQALQTAAFSRKVEWYRGSHPRTVRHWRVQVEYDTLKLVLVLVVCPFAREGEFVFLTVKVWRIGPNTITIIDKTRAGKHNARFACTLGRDVQDKH